ncbi:MAG: LacI family DNA-binding transcriptional regulator [Capsulimonadaceae bacterium]|nr:LacI family DNA-binding transcriptional regulator [Capsulimonadaceae bacterium]
MIKYQTIKTKLKEGIECGRYPQRGRLPAERDLAVMFGVSSVTARRAVTELVEEGLVERRPGSGAYIRANASSQSIKRITLIMSTARETQYGREILRILQENAEQLNWRVDFMYLSPGHEQTACRVIHSGTPALVFVDEFYLKGDLGEALKSAKGSAVVIGNRMDHFGVPSVMADDMTAIRMAIDHLKSAGHREIGLVTGLEDTYVSRTQIASWRSCFSGESPQTLDRRLIGIAEKHAECSIGRTYEVLRAYFQSHKADRPTALLCLTNEFAQGTLAACNAEGLRIPRDLSLVCSGDYPQMKFAQPPVTVVQLDIDLHVTYALELLSASAKGSNSSSDLLRIVQPFLIERQSVAAPASGPAALTKDGAVPL